MAMVCAWQTFLVHHSGSNWTFLFCAGDKFTVPPQLAAEHVYQLHNSSGYDGQFYHYVAHDPFVVRGFAPYLDSARLRYSRILLPVAAHLLAFGADRWIDDCYFAVELLSVFFGTYWLSRYSASHSRNVIWGLGFLLVPAVLVSSDRMTVDGLLASLCVGFVLCAEQGIDWKVYLVAILAVLTRETGGVLIVAYCGWLLSNRRCRAALLFGTAAVPAILWYAFVISHTNPIPRSKHFFFFPLARLANSILHPASYISCNYLAALGIALAIAWSMRLAFGGLQDARAIAIYQFAAVTVLLPIGDLNAFTRLASPLLLLLATVSFVDADITFSFPLIACALAVIGSRSIYLLNSIGPAHP